MKVTIKKLLKMGLAESQIKEILEIDSEQYKKLYSNGRGLIIENLPKKIDFVLKGGNVSDYKIINLFDEIYKINNIEKLEVSSSEKIRMIKEFPNFIKYIELKIIHDQIEELNSKKENYLAKVKDLDEQINSLELQINIVNNEAKPEVEKQESIPTLIVNEDVTIYNAYPQGGKRVHIKGFIDRGLRANDYVDIADTDGITRYQISNFKNPKNLKYMQYLKYVEKIIDKKE